LPARLRMAASGSSGRSNHMLGLNSGTDAACKPGAAHLRPRVETGPLAYHHELAKPNLHYRMTGLQPVLMSLPCIL
jgi:hypothetical protein